MRKNKLASRLPALCLAVVLAVSGHMGGVICAKGAEISIVGDYAEGELLVVFEDEVSETDAKQVVSRKKGKEISFLETADSKIAVVELPKGQAVASAIAKYSRDARVACVQPNYRYVRCDEQAKAGQSSAQAAGETIDWFMENIHVADAWALVNSVSHSKTCVAVLDTGVDINHPDLQANLDVSRCVDMSGDGSAALKGDDDGHGTHVTGIIAATANNGIGVAGVAAGSDNSCVRVFVVDIFDGEYTDTAHLIRGMQYASSNGAKVINCSVGGEAAPGDELLESMVNRLEASGITVVCAAGNEHTSALNYPSDLEACIAVMSTGRSNRRSSFSNYGIAKDISAPGEEIYSTYPTSTRTAYAKLSGTSMASPVVAGVVALMYSVNPSLSVKQIKSILYRTAEDIGSPGYDIYTGFGLVNAKEALSRTIAGGDALNEPIPERSVSSGSERPPSDGSSPTREILLWDVSLKPGESAQVPRMILPSTAGRSLLWSSSDTEVATVNMTGVVMGHKKGAATLTAQARDDSGISASCMVFVGIDAGSDVILADMQNMSLEKGNSLSLSNNIIMLRSAVTMSWSSSDSNVVSVSENGRITANKYGSAVITVKASAGELSQEEKCTVTVPQDKVGKSTISRLQKVSSTSLKVTYKKVNGADGYQIAYSSSSNFAKSSTKYVDCKSVSKRLNGLARGKTYYVKVRAYRIDSKGKRVYGAYSTVKKIKL